MSPIDQAFQVDGASIVDACIYDASISDIFHIVMSLRIFKIDFRVWKIGRMSMCITLKDSGEKGFKDTNLLIADGGKYIPINTLYEKIPIYIVNKFTSITPLYMNDSDLAGEYYSIIRKITCLSMIGRVMILGIIDVMKESEDISWEDARMRYLSHVVM